MENHLDNLIIKDHHISLSPTYFGRSSNSKKPSLVIPYWQPVKDKLRKRQVHQRSLLSTGCMWTGRLFGFLCFFNYLFFLVNLFSKEKKSKISKGLISIKIKLLHVAQNYAISWLSLLKLILDLDLTKCMNVVCYSTNKCQLSSFFFHNPWDFVQNADNIIT